MEKLITKENIFVTACVIFTLVQMNLFATKLDLANIKLELMEYTNQKVKIVDDDMDKSFHELNTKLDKLLMK